MRMSKYQFFVWIVLATFLFLLIQLVFVNYLKTFYMTNNGEKEDTVRYLNPRFHRFDSYRYTSQLSKLSSSSRRPNNLDRPIDIPDYVASNDSNIGAKRYAIEFKVPLDSLNGNKPEIFYQLPFNNRKNLHLDTIFVEEHYRNRSKTKSEEKILPRGVDRRKLDLYLPDDNGMFQCLNSEQKISYAQLNDDFCDCVDATDEPGTAACQFSTFYCSTQNENLEDNFIPSYRVEDRFCDCCDGSDESVKKCPNTCQELIKKSQDEKTMKKKAQNEKQKYLIDGLSKNENLYGPKGVFYRLGSRCFEIKWSDYNFEVCPYKRVSQIKPYKNSRSTNLGTDSELVLAEISHKQVWILKMGNGDTEFCSQPRHSEIRFLCGIEDHLQSVQEPQKCLYVFELLTPAAC